MHEKRTYPDDAYIRTTHPCPIFIHHIITTTKVSFLILYKTMAKLIVLLLTFNLLISTTITMAGGRFIPPDDDVIENPDMFFSYDPGYLIPGLGRGLKPRSNKGFNPFTYDPITGGSDGIPGFTYARWQRHVATEPRTRGPESKP